MERPLLNELTLMLLDSRSVDLCLSIGTWYHKVDRGPDGATSACRRCQARGDNGDSESSNGAIEGDRESAIRNRLAAVVPWSYHGQMSSVVKRSVSLPADVFEALEQQAAEEGRTVSAALADAADLWLATRRGLRAIRAWEREHGALTAGELAAADRELDRVGVGRH